MPKLATIKVMKKPSSSSASKALGTNLQVFKRERATRILDKRTSMGIGAKGMNPKGS